MIFEVLSSYVPPSYIFPSAISFDIHKTVDSLDRLKFFVLPQSIFNLDSENIVSMSSSQFKDNGKEYAGFIVALFKNWKQQREQLPSEWLHARNLFYFS